MTDLSTVALIARKGNIGYMKSFGMRDIENNQPMTNEAIFRIASMTKAIVSCKVAICEGRTEGSETAKLGIL